MSTFISWGAFWFKPARLKLTDVLIHSTAMATSKAVSFLRLREDRSALAAAPVESDATLRRKLSTIEDVGHASVHFRQMMQFELWTLP